MIKCGCVAPQMTEVHESASNLKIFQLTYCENDQKCSESLNKTIDYCFKHFKHLF